MNEQEAVEVLTGCGALLKGHFLLSSGLHSDAYVQCAKLLRFPETAARVLSQVAAEAAALRPEVACGPAVGGILVSYEIARQLSLESIFTERENGVVGLRRGFAVKPGARVLITEDVVTTGLSTMETARALTELGAEVVGVACIADRRSDKSSFPFPVISAVRLDIATYAAGECPLCLEGASPPVKPGSRTL